MLNYLCSFFTYPQLTSTSSGSSEESTDHEHIINRRSAPESEDDPHNDKLSGLSLQSESTCWVTLYLWYFICYFSLPRMILTKNNSSKAAGNIEHKVLVDNHNMSDMMKLVFLKRRQYNFFIKSLLFRVYYG